MVVNFKNLDKKIEELFTEAQKGGVNWDSVTESQRIKALLFEEAVNLQEKIDQAEQSCRFLLTS